MEKYWFADERMNVVEFLTDTTKNVTGLQG